MESTEARSKSSWAVGFGWVLLLGGVVGGLNFDIHNVDFTLGIPAAIVKSSCQNTIM